MRLWPKAAAVTRSMRERRKQALRRLARHELDQRRIDLGAWREGGGRNGEENAGVRAPLGEHGQPPVILGSRLGHDAVGHLALEHQHEPIEPRRPWLGLEPADEQRRGDAVGQIGDDAGGRGEAQGAAIDLARIGGDDRRAVPDRARRCRAERGGNARPSRCDDPRRAFDKQRTCEAARAGADFDDGRSFERTCGAGDAAGQIEIEQEILA